MSNRVRMYGGTWFDFQFEQNRSQLVNYLGKPRFWHFNLEQTSDAYALPAPIYSIRFGSEELNSCVGYCDSTDRGLVDVSLLPGRRSKNGQLPSTIGGRKSYIVPTPPQILPIMAENPFLFPSDLLNVLTNRSHDTHSYIRLRIQEVIPAKVAIPTDDVDPELPSWLLVHAKPRQEKKLADQLQSMLIPHYLPVTKCHAITRGRARWTRAPQFPGYLFLWVNPAQRRTALETNRIVATHAVAGQSALSEQLWILADLIEKGVALRVEERLAAGQNVRVKSGLLKDKQGTIIKRGGKTRLFVFVSELLGGVSLEIDQSLLEAI